MKFSLVFASQDLEIDLPPGTEVIVHPFLPLDSAVLLNHIGEIVGIYSDGQLVAVTLDSAINYLAHYPLAVKKKPLLEVSDE